MPSPPSQPDPQPVFATRTTTKLLDALRDHTNEPVWAHIDARYRPVIKGLARRLGVSDTDAEEVAQQSLAEFVKAYRENRYDRTKGRLSSWILGIAHHTTLRAIRDRKREGSRGIGGDGGGIPDSVDEAHLRTVWTDERDRVILMKALATVRDESSVDDRTLLAFELVALRAVPAAEAARQCNMTVDQIYVARSRVTRRLRTLVRDMTAAFEEDA